MWMVRKWRKLHLLEYLIYFAILRTLSPVILNQSQLNTIRRVINDILWPYFYIIVLMRKTCEHFFSRQQRPNSQGRFKTKIAKQYLSIKDSFTDIKIVAFVLFEFKVVYFSILTFPKS